MQFYLRLLFLSCVALLTGCQPAYVINSPQNYEFEYCKQYSDAWATTRDVFLLHEFSLRSSHKDDGFVRTEWLYKEYPSLGVYIRTRFQANFLPTRKVVRVTPEVEFLSGNEVLRKEVPIVNEILRELDERLRCLGDEPKVLSKGTPPANR